MFIHTEESLQEFEDYIEQLEERIGLTPETYKEVKTAISKERTKLKNLAISGVSNSALNEDKGHGICKEDGCEKFAIIDYNGHGHWNCQSCYDSNERYFEANYD